MPAFNVRTVVIDESERSIVDDTVHAAYYATDGDFFLTFKDADHKQVASYNVRNVVSVTRQATQSSIGTVVVNVAPELDEAAMGRLVDEITSRVRKAERAL